MTRIREQQKKRKLQEILDINSPLHSPTTSISPSSESASDWWENFSTRFSGYTPDSLFKVSRKTFEYICGLVEEEMMTGQNYTTQRRESLALNDRVAIALTRLSTGESFEVVGNLFGVNISAAYQITWRFVEAIEKKGFHHLHWPKTEEEITDIKFKFEGIRGLPNCCGAIDTIKFMVSLAADNAQRRIWCDQENNPCMILQAVVDPDMRFLDIITGLPGCLSEPNALCEWNLFSLCEEGKRLNGKKLKLAKNKEKIGEYIVGNGGYPLLPWLLTPYNEEKKLSNVRQDFNKRLYETMKVAKMAFKRLTETWKIIQGVVWRLDKHRLPRILYACCVLHNIMIDLKDGFIMQDENFLQSYDNSPKAHQPKCKFRDKTASVNRNNLALYLSSKLPPFSCNGVETVAKHVDLFEDDVVIEEVDSTVVGADLVIIEDATDQLGQMETEPAPSLFGIENSQPPDLAITTSNLREPVQSRKKRRRSHNSHPRESSPKWGENLSHQESADKAVCRNLDVSTSKCDKLHDLVQELRESNKILCESAAQKDADLLSLRSENEALKLETSEIAALRAKVTDLEEKIQAKKALEGKLDPYKVLADTQKELEATFASFTSRSQASFKALLEDNVRDELEDLQKSYKKLEEINTKLNAVVNEQGERESALQGKYEAAEKARIDAVELADVRSAEANSLKLQLEEVRKEAEEANAVVVRLSKELEEVRKEAEEANTVGVRLGKELEEVRKEAEEANTVVVRLSKELEDVRKEAEEANAVVVHLSKALEEVRKEAEEANTVVVRLSKALEEVRKEANTVVVRLSKELEEVRKEAEEANTVVVRLSKELEEARACAANAVADFKISKEYNSAILEYYDLGGFHVARCLHNASPNKFPGLPIIADWLTDNPYDDTLLALHPLIPFSERSIAKVHATRKLMGLPPWVPPPKHVGNLEELISFFAEGGTMAELSVKFPRNDVASGQQNA